MRADLAGYASSRQPPRPRDKSSAGSGSQQGCPKRGLTRMCISAEGAASDVTRRRKASSRKHPTPQAKRRAHRRVAPTTSHIPVILSQGPGRAGRERPQAASPLGGKRSVETLGRAAATTNGVPDPCPNQAQTKIEALLTGESRRAASANMTASSSRAASCQRPKLSRCLAARSDQVRISPESTL